ncbi:MAG: DUF664 domain-containing protein [bacterium]|nr:DUF664 domain-containing protein [bacterium]
MRLSDVFSNYFTVRAEMLEAVKDLTQDQLDWKSDRHPNSIGKLLAHIAEAEYWWITLMAAQKEEYVKGCFDQFKEGQSLEANFALLKRCFEDTREYLENEDTEDWDSLFYDIKGRKEKVSKRWLVWHVVEHQARHRGQIFMLMRMQGLDSPDV